MSSGLGSGLSQACFVSILSEFRNENPLSFVFIDPSVPSKKVVKRGGESQREGSGQHQEKERKVENIFRFTAPQKTRLSRSLSLSSLFSLSLLSFSLSTLTLFVSSSKKNKGAAAITLYSMSEKRKRALRGSAKKPSFQRSPRSSLRLISLSQLSLFLAAPLPSSLSSQGVLNRST